MKRKGFTLVELLAVIAILAILVIIALPNVMGMFNEAKKNSFTTEVKQIYKEAQQQWISDSMFNTSDRVYARCKTCTVKSLDLTGRTELEYYIKINKSGSVVKYYVTDGTYQYSYEGDDLKIEDIKDIKAIADITDDSQKVQISDDGNGEPMRYVYSGLTGNLQVGEAIPSNSLNKIFDDYHSINTFGYKFFHKHGIKGNVIQESYVGFIYNNQEYDLKGGSSEYYSSNKAILDNTIGSSNCVSQTVDSVDGYRCNFDGNHYVKIGINGYVRAEADWSYCFVTSTGRSYCYYSL